jgi:hypothetical protein
MTVPSELVSARLAVLILLGAFIILYAIIILISGNKAGTASRLVVPVPWNTEKGVTIKGPAWLILIAVGVVMIAAPILREASQKSVDVTYPPDSVREVQDTENLKKEDFSKFYFLRDLSVLDLRQSQKADLTSKLPFLKSRKQDKAIRPAVLSNVMHLLTMCPRSKKKTPLGLGMQHGTDY